MMMFLSLSTLLSITVGGLILLLERVVSFEVTTTAVARDRRRFGIITRPPSTSTSAWRLPRPPLLLASSNDNDDDNDEEKFTKKGGDPLRAATGIRPSLHPLTINAIATVLRKRAQKDLDLPLQTNDQIKPIDVALSAGKIAADTIAQRQATNTKDFDKEMQLLPQEEQTVAGRIVGVTMRLDDLEMILHEKCLATKWIAKYNEWDTFGVFADEASDITAISERIMSDPLFTMSRAECLLAIYLNQVEAPELLEKEATVPDNSRVDFLDSDRKEVLL